MKNLTGRFPTPIFTLAFVATLLSAPGPTFSRADEFTLTVSAGQHDRAGTPITVALPAKFAAETTGKSITLVPSDGGDSVEAQFLPGESPELAWVLQEPLAKGASRIYRLEIAEGQRDPLMGCSDDGKFLHVRDGKTTILSYAHAVVAPPEGLDPVFARSGFIHPLRTPHGRIVTDDFPLDHAHQHAIFLGFPKAEVGGRPVDFWNQAKKSGSIRHHEILGTGGGVACAWFKVTLRYSDLTAPGGALDVAEECWTVRVWDTPGTQLIDFESEITCLTDEPIIFPKYHYGGFAIRGSASWYDQKGRGGEPGKGFDFLTSEGGTKKDGNHSAVRWVDIHGTEFDGTESGVVAIAQPSNFRYPQTVRLHPEQPYFCFAPMVTGSYKISPGETYLSRYRLFAHDGQPSAKENNRVAQDLADPPVVQVSLSDAGEARESNSDS